MTDVASPETEILSGYTLESDRVPIDSLEPWPGNARLGNIAIIKSMLVELGQYRTIAVQKSTRRIMAGNNTWRAAVELGWTEIAVTFADVPDAVAERINVADNRANDLATYDLQAQLAQLQRLPDLSGTGWTPPDIAALAADLDRINGTGGGGSGGPKELPPSLRERYGYPPFSVLDARSGEWQDRKREWIDLGIKSEVGRGGTLAIGFDPMQIDDQQNANERRKAELKKSGGLLWKSVTAQDPQFYAKKRTAEAEVGHELTLDEFIENHYNALDHAGWASGTSVFDPVLCELVYRWWARPPAGEERPPRVVDPFAGGSVRGILAAALGCAYTGIDLRPEQIEANNDQWDELGALFGTAADAPPADDEVDNTPDLTPIEDVDGYRIKRDDAFNIGGSRGGKVRSCWAIASQPGVIGLVTAGSRQSPQVNIVASIAARLGVPCRVHVPAASGPLTPELAAAAAAGADIVEHRPGYNNVIVARAREDADASGWTEIPFGMETPIAVEQTATQVANLPGDVRRIVVPVGSGMSLAGILQGLADAGRRDVEILGVQVGADPAKRLDRYAPGWRDRVRMVKSALDYHAHAPVTRLGSIDLDPVYEAKCLPYLEAGDLLWVVGRRATAGTVRSGPAPAPTWIAGDSIDRLPELPAGHYDLAFSCPPYFNLERYSDDPADISNGSDYSRFDALYGRIVAATVERVRPGGHLVLVVSEVRDSKAGGEYVGLIPDTIRHARAAGCSYESELILLNQIGSAAVRISNTFEKNYRPARLHQNVLVFRRPLA